MDSIRDNGEFPDFEDADVVIVLSAARIYRLHSWMIRKNIPVMGNLLTEASSAVFRNRSRRNGTNLRWRIDLEVHVDGARGRAECNFILGVSCISLHANFK